MEAKAAPRHEHPVLIYRGAEDFLQVMVPYVQAGLDNDEVVFVAARRDMVSALRDALGDDAPRAAMEDTDQWHPHPYSRLRAFYELLTQKLHTGATRFRLAGEPVWWSRPPDLVREWQRYESALNAVLAPYPASLICLYDASLLKESIIETAKRTHPWVHWEGSEGPSETFLPPEEFLREWGWAPSGAPSHAARMTAGPDMSPARWFVQEEARGAGVTPQRAGDLALATNEVLTNAVMYGGGSAELAAWPEADSFVCQVNDAGPGISDPLAGWLPPSPTAPAGRGLWLARQLVDLLQIVPGPSGTTVRLHVPRG